MRSKSLPPDKVKASLIRKPAHLLNYKTMKKILFIISAMALVAGCYKTPNTDQFSSGFIILTNYDCGISFKDYKTFVLPPYVGLIANSHGYVGERISDDYTYFHTSHSSMLNETKN